MGDTSLRYIAIGPRYKQQSRQDFHSGWRHFEKFKDMGALNIDGGGNLFQWIIINDLLATSASATASKGNAPITLKKS